MNNYDDVLGQLQQHGLIVKTIETGRLVRCKAEGNNEKRGWYAVHEMPISGSTVLVGTYGIWQGDDNGLIKIELDDEYKPNKEQLAAIRKRVAEDKKRAEAERKRRAMAASKRAEKAWHVGTAEGEVDYFDKKNVQVHGLRYSKGGSAMVPMLDTAGMVHGIQFIFDSEKHKDEIAKLKRNKTYWPSGLSKKGHFHLIGGSPVDLILITEGYATAASLYEATGIPVVVAFDANNLISVGETIRKHYNSVKIIFCADDDALAKCMNCKKSIEVKDSKECPHCKTPHRRKNTGVETAGLAAMQLGMYSVKPLFADNSARFEFYSKNQGKHTDFNDLHSLEGLHTVRTQIEASIESFGIRRKGLSKAALVKEGEGADEDIKVICLFEELITRFVLVYGEGSIVYDKKYRKLIRLKDLSDACTNREIFRRWCESDQREIAFLYEIDFDPGNKNPLKKYEKYKGILCKPIKGKCELILELLEYMCGTDKEGQLMNDFILNWLSYPLQNEGAKMKTAIVIHGPQGTGKNLFFDVIMAIYGEYGGIIDQLALEDKFTDWASNKMFMIADEVIAQSDAHRIKNKMKGLITGEFMRINPKTKISFVERNHINIVFLSNERMPVVLEEDDRRHGVVHTPEKLSPELYSDIAEEIKNGGTEALYHYLLNRPLGSFNEHTKPPLTKAKQALIDQSLFPTSRFYNALVNSEIFTSENQKLWPIEHDQLYELFCFWCNKEGERKVQKQKLIGDIKSKKGVLNIREWHRIGEGAKKERSRFILIPGCIEMDPGATKMYFYRDCINEMKKLLDNIKQEW